MQTHACIATISSSCQAPMETAQRTPQYDPRWGHCVGQRYLPELHQVLPTLRTRFPAGDVWGISSWKKPVGPEFYSTFKIKKKYHADSFLGLGLQLPPFSQWLPHYN